MIKRAELKQAMCRIDGEQLQFDGEDIIAAGPMVKDGAILKRAVLRVFPKGVEDLEFCVHTEYMEESFVLPDGTIDAVGAMVHYDNGQYNTDFDRAHTLFIERCKSLAHILMGVALA